MWQPHKGHRKPHQLQQHLFLCLLYPSKRSKRVYQLWRRGMPNKVYKYIVYSHSLRLAVCPDVRMHRCTDRHVCVCERKKASGECTSSVIVRVFVVVLQRVPYSRPLLLLPCLTYFVIEFNAGGNERRLDVACGTKRQPVAAAVPYASACCCCDCCCC